MKRFLLTVFFAIPLLASSACGPETPATISLEDISQYEVLATAVPTATAINTCTLSFSHPSPGESLPEYGPVDFSWSLSQPASWSNHWFLEKYILEVRFPGGSPSVSYDVQNSANHKTLYMENFQPAGTYTATVSAIGWAPSYASGSVLCVGTLTFTKKEYHPKENKPGQARATPCPIGVRCQ